MKQWPDAPLIRYISFAGKEVVVANSTAAYKDVLQTHCYNFKRPKWWRRMVLPFLGHGVASMDGETHRAHRKILNICFTTSKVDALLPLFRKTASDLGDFLDKIIATDQNGGGMGVFDCTETFGRAMLDVIGTSILGTDLSSLQSSPLFSVNKDQYGFYDAWKHIFSAGKIASVLMFAAGHLPVRWLPLAANYNFKRANAFTFGTVRRLIQERRNEIGSTVEAGKHHKLDDMLSFMIKETLPGGAAEGMLEDHLVGHILQVVAAGHETSADVLSWTIYELTRTPEIQDKLRDEIAELLKRVDNPTIADINSMVYLDNVLKESLRVWTPCTLFLTFHARISLGII
jgi:cytochrome P450